MIEPYRFVLLGTGGHFTYRVLQALVGDGLYPQAYFQSGEPEQTAARSFAGIELDWQRTHSMSDILDAHGITGHFGCAGDLPGLIERYAAHFMLVACWPALLPNPVLQAVSLAALNLHPSLLPRYRGADPIGDQLRAGDFDFGISLHVIDERFDHGDIVLQQSVAVDEVSRANIERSTAEAGTRLFKRALLSYRSPGWRFTRQR